MKLNEKRSFIVNFNDDELVIIDKFRTLVGNLQGKFEDKDFNNVAMEKIATSLVYGEVIMEVNDTIIKWE